MASIYELSLMAQAIYSPSPSVAGWECREPFLAGGAGGFQAAAFTRGSMVVVTFRGTNKIMSEDGLADLTLGLGMNTNYFSAGEAYALKYAGNENAFVCGHSLGGAIAQIVANRRGFNLMSFNAPGVGVLASRNMMFANWDMQKIRIAGMLASAVAHPKQAWRDISSAFNVVNGLNLCLNEDPVSQIGLHYGKVKHIPGPTIDASQSIKNYLLQQHSIDTMVDVLKKSSIGNSSVFGLRLID